jgi:2-(1,2-epoxy-1,2-dihydrophenyl)acetyl-CoA isomerase
MEPYESTEGLHAGLNDDGVLTIRIDRPDRRGAIDDAIAQAMIAQLVAAGQDEQVRCVLLTGGADFCAGSDLVAKNAPTEQRPRVGSIQRRLPSTFHRLVPLLMETQVPVVAAVRGWASGLGLHLAVASDFCVAATDARFWEPFTTRGFTPDSAGSWLLPRLVGTVRARELLLLGRELSGAEAAQWGLIHSAVADDQVDADALAVATRLASGPTVALGLTKWLLTVSTDQSLGEQLRSEAFALELSSRSEDFREGLSAFREKRDPEFRGR